MVVAEDLRSAQRALEKIRVEYEPLPPVFDAVEALAPGAPILHEERGTNLLLEDSLGWGDIDEGFRQADRVFENDVKDWLEIERRAADRLEHIRDRGLLLECILRLVE